MADLRRHLGSSIHVRTKDFPHGSGASVLILGDRDWSSASVFSVAAMAAAAAALFGAGGAGAVGLGSGGDAGPGLQFGAGEDALVTRMNEWGRRVDASLGLLMGSFSDLHGEVVSTQVVLATTIQEAKVALNVMHEGFRQALDVSGASQRTAVEELINHARAKFLELETN